MARKEEHRFHGNRCGGLGSSVQAVPWAARQPDPPVAPEEGEGLARGVGATLALAEQEPDLVGALPRRHAVLGLIAPADPSVAPAAPEELQLGAAGWCITLRQHQLGTAGAASGAGCSCERQTLRRRRGTGVDGAQELRDVAIGGQGRLSGGNGDNSCLWFWWGRGVPWMHRVLGSAWGFHRYLGHLRDGDLANHSQASIGSLAHLLAARRTVHPRHGCSAFPPIRQDQTHALPDRL
mmetsp:Transcript_30097/g.75994  ORF Transcript_30097/g.75994 Transcript_30097/m.75994 type:complete len:237 (-) Transcript_30097:790-1500(-)